MPVTGLRSAFVHLEGLYRFSLSSFQGRGSDQPSIINIQAECSLDSGHQDVLGIATAGERQHFRERIQLGGNFSHPRLLPNDYVSQIRWRIRRNAVDLKRPHQSRYKRDRHPGESRGPEVPRRTAALKSLDSGFVQNDGAQICERIYASEYEGAPLAITAYVKPSKLLSWLLWPAHSFAGLPFRPTGLPACRNLLE